MMMLKVIVNDHPCGIHVSCDYESMGNTTDREKELINELAGVVTEDLRTKAKFEGRRLKDLKKEVK